MREFGEPVSEALRLEVLECVRQLVLGSPGRVEVKADDYVLEPAEAIVLDALTLVTEEGPVQLNLCRQDWHPPFEWLAEVTSDLPGTDYLKHYLVRENDIVLAHRRVLTVIDDKEAQLILADLQFASKNQADLA